MNWRNDLPTEDLYNCLLIIKQGQAIKILMGNYWAAVGKFAVYSDLIDPSEVYYYATPEDIMEDIGHSRLNNIPAKFNVKIK